MDASLILTFIKDPSSDARWKIKWLSALEDVEKTLFQENLIVFALIGEEGTVSIGFSL